MNLERKGTGRSGWSLVTKPGRQREPLWTELPPCTELGAVCVFSVIPLNPEWQSKSHSHSQVQRPGLKESLAQGHPASGGPSSLTCPDFLTRTQHRPQCPVLSHHQPSAEGLSGGRGLTTRVPTEVLTVHAGETAGSVPTEQFS